MVWRGDTLVIGLAALVVAAGALLAGPVRRRWPSARSLGDAAGTHSVRLGRWLLALGALLGLIGLVTATFVQGVDAYRCTTVAAAGMLIFAAFWSVALGPSPPLAQASLGLLAAGAMLAYLLIPRHSATATVLRGASYGLSGWAYVAAAGLLVAGLVHQWPDSGHASHSPSALFLSLATLCLTVSLAAQGAAAQWAWGHYWAGDPAEYLRLIGWDVSALGWVVTIESAAHRRVAVWSQRAATGIVIAVLLGSMALIKVLGLPSLYLVG